MLAWLDMLGLPQHKAALARRGVTGKTLVTLDAPALVLMGVEREQEQWAILQSVRDHVSLLQRYRKASALVARHGGSVLPSQALQLEECSSWASVDDSSFDDNSSSNGSTNSSTSSASPLLVRRCGSNLALQTQEAARRSSAPALATVPADHLPLDCLFKISRGNAGMRIVRAKRTGMPPSIAPRAHLATQINCANCRSQSSGSAPSCARTKHCASWTPTKRR